MVDPMMDARGASGARLEAGPQGSALEDIRAALEAMGEPGGGRSRSSHGSTKEAATIEEFADLPKAPAGEAGRGFALANPEPRPSAGTRPDGNSCSGSPTAIRRNRPHPAGKRATVCLSTQVGCKFRCAFCASG
jgi:hypothetical protein